MNPPTSSPTTVVNFPSSLRKRKNSTDHTNSASGTSGTKKSRTQYADRRRKAKRPSDYHLTKDEVPKEAESTKAALELHIRALWGLPDQASVPPVVTDQDKARFVRRFSSESEVRSSVNSALDENTAYIAEAGRLAGALKDSPSPGSTIAKNIERITGPALKFALKTVASFGLLRWAPDVLGGDADSMYNLLHEYIALTTFQQAATAHAYAHMGLIVPLTDDFVLMRKLYRSFVFSYMHRIAKAEAKKPGSAKAAKQMIGVYKRRDALAKGRIDVLKAYGFNKQVLALASETEAHSDDDLPEGTEESAEAVYQIAEKEGRSEKVKKFFRMADEQRRRMAMRRNRHCRQERRRAEPATPRPSTLTVLPREVPLDWFEPAYFNDLSVRERAAYTAEGIYIALPLEKHCATWADCEKWKNLPRKEFMEKYEMEQLEQYEEESEEESSESEMEED
ncbi:hypothetical protein LshimejAT787_0701760 [Lyophyllum shimeji]|uniref:Uncharacterized protein n=1 Tax=Lyophyllum shimeji TaxID=47721 RepID=A0A9P3PQ11_LYOSH|nr:hypothetical protein LshimejAT787_0701760 [Lyophyllum shimeji]